MINKRMVGIGFEDSRETETERLKGFKRMYKMVRTGVFVLETFSMALSFKRRNWAGGST